MTEEEETELLLQRINRLMPERTRDFTLQDLETLAYWLVDEEPPEQEEEQDGR